MRIAVRAGQNANRGPGAGQNANRGPGAGQNANRGAASPAGAGAEQIEPCLLVLSGSKRIDFKGNWVPEPALTYQLSVFSFSVFSAWLVG